MNGADMDYISLMTGVVLTLFGFALFQSDDYIDEEIEDSGNVIYTGKKKVLSCQTCRKLKTHVEIEPNLYQCPKCKREIDLR